MEEKLILQSSDNMLFTVSKKIVKMLHIFDTVSEDYISQLIKSNKCFLTGVHSIILNIIIEFCKYFNYIEPELLKRPFNFFTFPDIVNDNWIINFFNQMNIDILTSLINAAEMLKCSSILDYSLAKLGLWIRDSDVSELASLLKINSFSKDDIEKIQKENNWLMKINKYRISELGND